MCKQMNLEELCRYVLHQVPEADPGIVCRFARIYIRFPCDRSTAYRCARQIESYLIVKGSV